MTVTPEMLAKSGSEHAHQSALFCWAALKETQTKYPELEFMFAIPNGGERNKIVAGQLKAEGVKAGVWDIFLPVSRHGFHGLFIEMKRKPNDVSQEQKQFGCFCVSQNYDTAVAWDWTEAKRTLERYLS
jgi:hypothetical protein